MQNLDQTAIASYLEWWSDTGLTDPVQDEPHLWLQSVMPVADTMPLTPTRTIPVIPAQSGVGEPVPAPISRPVLPPHLAEFEHWLRDDPALPGATWSATRILPTGPAQAPVMVIADMPDIDDFTTGRLLAGPVGALFDAMLGAIGLSRANLRIASIALTRPAGGRWDDDSAAALRDIALHHITLAQPQRILLLGQLTCRLLTGENVPADGISLRNINHCGVTTTATAIHHPRVLLKQAALKRGAWTALKSLREPA